MKTFIKTLSSVMVAVMIMTMSSWVVFADAQSSQASQTLVFTDIVDTPYQTAVETLASFNVINGYGDGTFRPDSSITRAEACAMIYRGLPHNDLAYENPSSAFSDMDGAGWAADYIAYCAANDIIKGYGDGTFRPASDITNNEFITILVRAVGLADDQAMAWPSDYIAVAESIGLMSNVQDITLASNGNDAATRGNCAIMLYNASDSDSAADNENDASSGSTSSDGGTAGGAASDDSSADGTGDTSSAGESDTTDSSEQGSDGVTAEQSSVLANYTGRAYGIVTGVGNALDSSGNSCGTAEFMMNDTVYTVMTASTVSSDIFRGFNGKSGVVKMTFSKGRVTAVTQLGAELAAYSSSGKSYKYLVTSGPEAAGTDRIAELGYAFYKVLDAKSHYLYYAQSDEDKEGEYCGINSSAVIYSCEPDGTGVVYSSASKSDIEAGDYVVAFTVDDESQGVADIIIVIDSSDAANLLTMTGGTEYYGYLR